MKLKYQSATIDDSKSSKGLIESGGTYYFVHSKEFFYYEPVQKEDVQSASGISDIIGKGTVMVDLNGGFFVEAYQTPEFSNNIIPVGKVCQNSKCSFLQAVTEMLTVRGIQYASSTIEGLGKLFIAPI